ncbi:MAG: peptidoglycan DD-metalloendopeptidase family protein [Ancrocorticia sp.]|uniref:M23 family metallopeptidase n=1 Tax=Ancrocorticia sp. TaxID=2593684 RepID=UPI003F932837
MKVINETRESRRHEMLLADRTPEQIEFARRMAEESARRKAIREGAARRRARQAALAHLEQASLHEVAPVLVDPPVVDPVETDVLSQDAVSEAIEEGKELSRVERRRRERARVAAAAGSDAQGFTRASEQDSVPTAPSAEESGHVVGRSSAKQEASFTPRKPGAARGSSRPGNRAGKSTKPSKSGRKNLLQGMTVSALAVGGIAVPLLGMGNPGGNVAQAAQPLNASIVGGTTQQGSMPEALAGSPNAGIRSEATTMSEQASSGNAAASQCEPEGAQGLRAAFVEQDSSSSVVFPLDSGVYHRTSGFGPRVDPILGGSSYHAGQDYAAPSDTPIYAIADGTVTFAGGSTAGRSPNTIVVEHEINGKIYESWYVHMWDHGVLVNVGDKVSAGQQIGLVGSNGNSTGPHLHLEIHDPALGTADSVSSLVSPDQFLAEQGAVDINEICE